MARLILVFEEKTQEKRIIVLESFAERRNRTRRYKRSLLLASPTPAMSVYSIPEPMRPRTGQEKLTAQDINSWRNQGRKPLYKNPRRNADLRMQPKSR